MFELSLVVCCEICVIATTSLWLGQWLESERLPYLLKGSFDQVLDDQPGCMGLSSRGLCGTPAGGLVVGVDSELWSPGVVVVATGALAAWRALGSAGAERNTGANEHGNGATLRDMTFPSAVSGMLNSIGSLSRRLRARCVTCEWEHDGASLWDITVSMSYFCRGRRHWSLH